MEDKGKSWWARNIANIGTGKETSENAGKALKAAGEDLILAAEKSFSKVANETAEKMGCEVNAQIRFAKQGVDESIAELNKAVSGISLGLKKNFLLPLAVFGFVFAFFLAGALGFVLGKYG